MFYKRRTLFFIPASFIFLIEAVMSHVVASSQAIISHIEDEGFDLATRIKSLEQQDNLALPLEETKEITRQLWQFDLGQSLLKNKGLNGYWIAYLILHAPQKETLHPLEHWLVHEAPSAKATRERFYIFRQKLQENLTSDMSLASLPCGLMDDLLGLETSKIQNTDFWGIDLDDSALVHAQENALNHPEKKVSFLKKDAWHLGIVEQFDILTSSGLNIYEPCPDRLVALYKNFHQALKPDGLLIASFWTPPPSVSQESPWKGVAPEALIKQKALFGDIIQARWLTSVSESTMREHLGLAGFHVEEVLYDSQHIFPTILARKR